MNFTRYFSCIAAILLLVSCGQSSSADNVNNTTDNNQVSISFSGAFALYPLAQVWAQEYNKTHPDIRFDIQAGGAGKGLTDALSGAVDVGMFSREITDAEKGKGI